MNINLASLFGGVEDPPIKSIPPVDSYHTNDRFHPESNIGWLQLLNPLRLFKDTSTKPSPEPTGNYPQAVQSGEAVIKAMLAKNGLKGILDSLGTLAKFNKPGVYQNKDLDPGVLGEYSRLYNMIDYVPQPEKYVGGFKMEKSMQTPASANLDPRNTIIHEYAHSLQGRNDFAPPIFNKEYFDRPFPQVPQFQHVDPQHYGWVEKSIDNQEPSQSSLDAVKRIDPYYKTSPHEAYSQSFVNAFNFLTETAKNPKMDYRNYIGKLETNTPGTGQIVNTLLQSDLFKDHPLKKAFLPNKKDKVD